jgi:hypothetical protein
MAPGCSLHGVRFVLEATPATAPRAPTCAGRSRIIERSVDYDRAWDDHFHDRPCVSRCLFIVGDPEREHRAAQLALTHDTVLA